MNGLIQRHRTLGELLAELKARLGFVAQGPASNNNNPVMISFLQEAHDYVYDQLNPTSMRKKTIITLEQGSPFYDWHNDLDDENIDPGLVTSVWVIDGGSRTPLIQGISETDREDSSRTVPVKYDTLNGQIELWPIPDRPYGLMVEYIASKPRFAQSSDRPGVSDRLLLLYALANAKAHFRHPDSQSVAVLFNTKLRLEKIRQHENRRFFLNGHYRKNRTVTGSNGDYRLSVE